MIHRKVISFLGRDAKEEKERDDRTFSRRKRLVFRKAVWFVRALAKMIPDIVVNYGSTLAQSGSTSLKEFGLMYNMDGLIK